MERFLRKNGPYKNRKIWFKLLEDNQYLGYGIILALKIRANAFWSVYRIARIRRLLH